MVWSRDCIRAVLTRAFGQHMSNSNLMKAEANSWSAVQSVANR